MRNLSRQPAGFPREVNYRLAMSTVHSLLEAVNNSRPRTLPYCRVRRKVSSLADPVSSPSRLPQRQVKRVIHIGIDDVSSVGT